MELIDSSLWKDMTDIFEDGEKPVHYRLEATLIANKIEYELLQITAIELVQDFDNNFSDEIMLLGMIPAGKYAVKIFPFQNNLELILKRIPMLEVSNEVDPEQKIQIKRYTAILNNKKNPMVETGMNSPSETALDLMPPVTIELQLIDKTVEKLRTIRIGGNFRDVEPDKFLQAVMTTESRRLILPKNEKPIGVTIFDADNPLKRGNMMIPYDTRLVDLPRFVNEHCGGIYSSGMSYYYMENMWYIYPSYNVERFPFEKKTMTCLVAPKNKLPKVERTYRMKGNNITIIATGEIKHQDNTDHDQMNFGNGVRFTDALALFNNFANIVGSKAVVSRKSNNFEMMSEKRENKVQVVPVSSASINNNPFKEYSKLARRQGAVYTFIWQNSNPKKIFPGMMVKVKYLEGDEIKTIYGVMVRAFHYIQSRSPGMTADRHVTETAISIFIKPLDKKQT